MSKIKSLLKLTAVASVIASASGSASAQSFLPRDYYSRFSSTELAASNADGANGFGLRYFPLPIAPDIRVSLVKRPHYWEYAASTRQKDTTFFVGMVDNGDTATVGKFKMELNHDPFKGVQFQALYQGLGSLSKVAGGYAFTVYKDRFRVLNNIGVANQGDNTSLYTQSEIGGGYTQAVNPNVDVRLGGTARLFTYPLDKKYQASIDINPSVDVRPMKGVALNITHLERFATSSAGLPIGDLNYGRYQETKAMAAYRFNATEDFRIGMLRTRLTRNWTDKQTFWYNDILFNFKALPVLIGPTIGYQWYPATANNSRMIFSIATAGK